MKQESEITLTPDIRYSTPTVHAVMPPTEKSLPTHVWYPSTGNYGDIQDVYDVDQIDSSTGDKRFIIVQ